MKDDWKPTSLKFCLFYILETYESMKGHIALGNSAHLSSHVCFRTGLQWCVHQDTTLRSPLPCQCTQHNYYIQLTVSRQVATLLILFFFIGSV